MRRWTGKFDSSLMWWCGNDADLMPTASRSHSIEIHLVIKTSNKNYAIFFSLRSVFRRHRSLYLRIKGSLFRAHMQFLHLFEASSFTRFSFSFGFSSSPPLSSSSSTVINTLWLMTSLWDEWQSRWSRHVYTLCLRNEWKHLAFLFFLSTKKWESEIAIFTMFLIW